MRVRKLSCPRKRGPGEAVLHILRTALPFATAHTICASRDGPKKSGFSSQCLLKHIFCAVYSYEGKADLGKGYWNAKRKLEGVMDFSKIIKLQDQFGKKCHPFFFFFFVFSRFLESLLLNYLCNGENPR